MRGSGVQPGPRVHVVTDDEVLASPGFASRARALLERGGGRVALHVRGPRTPGGELLALARPLAEAAAGLGALLVVNDRIDVALASGARGVHLARRSLPVGEARKLLRGNTRVGVSAHAAPEAADAEAEGVDWCFVGSVYPTRTHPGRAAAGLDLVGVAVRSAPTTPVLAIGGVTPGRVREVMGAGAYGIAVISGIWQAPDPERALETYLSEAAAAGGPEEET